MPAAARPWRSRHKLASSSSSEGEDSPGPPQPTQKRLRHSGPSLPATARMPGPARDGEAASRAAVGSAGSAQSCRLGPSPPRGPGEAPTPWAALLPKEECLAGDWLEEDLPLASGHRGSHPPRPRSSAGGSRHSASGSGSDASAIRPRARARQSRLSCLKRWSAVVRADAACSSAAEPARSPYVQIGRAHV